MPEIKPTYQYEDVQSALHDAMKALAHRDEMIMAMNDWLTLQEICLFTPFPNPQQIGAIPSDYIVMVKGEANHFTHFAEAFKYAFSMFVIYEDNETDKISERLRAFGKEYSKHKNVIP